MKHCAIGILVGLLALSGANAQKGNRKGHENMAKIVPDKLIPAAPVLDVNDALEAFTIHEDFVIEAVVAEPLVDKPVALAFDGRGRMWVCEMRGYMADIDGTTEDKPQGRIVILEDTTGNGSVDKRTVFLEDLLLPRSIAIVPGGILFGDQQNLYFVENDNDKPKGEPKILDPKYAQGGNVEHKSNGMMPAIDNWMYNAKSAYRYKFQHGQLVKEATSFRGQWGISQDNLGRLFFNSNSTMLIGDRVLPNLLEGNKTVKMKASITERVGSNAVHPSRVTPGLNRAYISSLNGYRSNTIDPKTFKLTNCTAACGPVIYRGSNFPEKFNGWSFICESGVQMVKAVKVDYSDGHIKGSHPLGEKEFLTSTDERFRPVNIHNAPDGSLYLVDLYHGIIQHKTYMTSYLREQTLSRKLEGPGLGHGRIYRIRAKSKPLAKVPNLEKADTDTLIAQLASPTGALRDLAQQQLIGRQADPAPVRSALGKAVSKKMNLATIHLLWTLEGLGALQARDILATIGTGNEDLIASALYAALSLSDSDRAPLTDKVASLSAKPMTLPYQARILASIDNEKAQRALVKLLKKNGKASFIREAAIAGLSTNAHLFATVNKGQYSEKKFDDWLAAAAKGPKKSIDPATFLKGDHLASYKRGQALFEGKAACIGCHGATGEGLPNLGPTLTGSDWVTGDKDRLTKILLHGLTGPIKINAKTFTPVAFMPGLAQNPTISDKDMADVLTYIRAGWSNRASQISVDHVKKVRNDTANRSAGQMYTQQDFDK
ncbi:MAG: c-type cytochrome [Akkermansiaceae bacterium]|nr:c-type cytochrome [Akkermansiaceae bacterium]